MWDVQEPHRINLRICLTLASPSLTNLLPITAISENKTYSSNSGGVLSIDSIADNQVLELFSQGQFIKEIVIYKAIANTKGRCPLLFINPENINNLPTITLSGYIAKGIEKTKKGAIEFIGLKFKMDNFQEGLVVELKTNKVEIVKNKKSYTAQFLKKELS